MARMAEHVGQVLMQRAAERDVERLGTAADPEHRHAASHRTADQSEFECVTPAAVVDRLVGGRMSLLSIGRRIDIAATRDDQAVKAVEHAFGDVGVDRLRRQQHRNAACEVDPFEIDGGQIARTHVPDPGLHPLQVGGQPQNRSRAAQSHASSPNRSPRS